MPTNIPLLDSTVIFSGSTLLFKTFEWPTFFPTNLRISDEASSDYSRFSYVSSFIFGLYLLFHWSDELFMHQYHMVLFIIVLKYTYSTHLHWCTSALEFSELFLLFSFSMWIFTSAYLILKQIILLFIWESNLWIN